MTELRDTPAHQAWMALPTPAKLEAYERIAPGTAARMFSMIEAQATHARDMQRAAQRLRMAGYGCALVTVFVLALLAKYFVDHGAAVEGAAVVVSGTVSIVGIFVTGRLIARSGSAGRG